MDPQRAEWPSMQFCRDRKVSRRGDPAKDEIPGWTILMADDDPDDYLLVKEALEKAGFRGDLRLVSDGEELMDYLQGCSRFANEEVARRPSLILLDLNMPRKDGRDTLREIKSHPDLKTIPVAVFTTSEDVDDMTACYDAGADLYVTKPNSFESLVETMAALGKDWLGV